jgi:hypothetical protein
MKTTFEIRHTEARAATLGTMAPVQAASAPAAAMPAAAPGARYLSRPGHQVLVAASLADLRGPTHGAVELPIWLFWYPDRTFDLDGPGMLAWMYQIVLREASSTEDLAYLNGDTLSAVWADLYLPRGVRQAWEDQHPALRAAAAPAA